MHKLGCSTGHNALSSEARVREITDEELARIPAQKRIDDARESFDEVALAADSIDFLTLSHTSPSRTSNPGGGVPPSELRPPDHLRSAVHIAGNGELFWPTDVAGAAARWLAGVGLAIVGGEVYGRFRGAWATYLREWTTTPARLPAEPWGAYVERSLAQALENVATGEDLDLFFFAHDRPDRDPASTCEAPGSDP